MMTGWIFLHKTTSPELSQATLFDSQVEGADDQLGVLLILRLGLFSSPRTATVGRRLSFMLGRCQGHRGKGLSTLTGNSQKQIGILFSPQTYQMSIPALQSWSSFFDPILKKPLKTIASQLIGRRRSQQNDYILLYKNLPEGQR